MDTYLGYVVKVQEAAREDWTATDVHRFTYFFHSLGALKAENGTAALQPPEGKWENDVMLFADWRDVQTVEKMADRFPNHRLMVLQMDQWHSSINAPSRMDTQAFPSLEELHLYPVYPLNPEDLAGNQATLEDTSLRPGDKICLTNGIGQLGPFSVEQREDGSQYVTLPLEQHDFFVSGPHSAAPAIQAEGGDRAWTLLYLLQDTPQAMEDLLPDELLLQRYEDTPEDPEAIRQALDTCRQEALSRLEGVSNADALANARVLRLKTLLQLRSTRAAVQMEEKKLQQAQAELHALEDTLEKTLQHMPEALTEAALTSALAEVLRGQASSQTAVQAPPAREPPAAEPAGEALEVLTVETVQPLHLERDALLQAITDGVQTARPNYTRNDILNIAICLTQNLLTVFSGPPGCGKTSICKLFGKVLGLDQAGRFVPVSVERGWTSRRDFIGNYNPLTESFTVNNEAVFHGLQALGKEWTGDPTLQLPLLILLDEANLSPMEHYWSDFMSIADDPSGTASINLGQGYVFPIPETLHFAATINNDDTTEPLSPRLVDRAWVITLPELPADTDPLSLWETPGPVPPEAPLSWQSLKGAFSGEASPENGFSTVLEHYQKITAQLQDMGFGVSPRVARSVIRYWNAAAAEGCFTAESPDGTPGDAALDFAVAQRLLPKLSGSGETFRTQLETLRYLCAEANLPRSEKILRDILARGNHSDLAFYSFFLY